MTREKAIEVLTAHNTWRRAPLGTGGYGKIQDPKEIGLAIDFAVSALKKQLSPLPKTEKQDETTGSTPN
jgi:hypothetical protein